MRDLKTLYQLLLDNFDEFNQGWGICDIISRLQYLKNLITFEEEKILNKDFQSKKPKIFSKFWWHISYNKIRFSWWWSLTKKGDKQRKKFIGYLISKL